MIYKESLSSASIPYDWKIANITPIFKKGSKSDAGNYRPISLTSVCSKILESIIRDFIVQHLEKYDLLINSQHGSTHSAHI